MSFGRWKKWGWGVDQWGWLEVSPIGESGGFMPGSNNVGGVMLLGKVLFTVRRLARGKSKIRDSDLIEFCSYLVVEGDHWDGRLLNFRFHGQNTNNKYNKASILDVHPHFGKYLTFIQPFLLAFRIKSSPFTSIHFLEISTWPKLSSFSVYTIY